MSIITKIPSEIRNFFTGKRINPAFSKFMTLLEGMRISDKDLGGKKRSDDYETIGGLFADIYEGVHELTVVEKIWSIIIDVIAIVAEIFTIDENELMEQIIRDNRRLKAMLLIAQTA